MNQVDQSSVWDYFDCIYCISLADREDRRRQAQTQFARVGLASRVKFFIADRHPQDCEQGIYESHMACIQEGLAAGARNMIVFEDDVVFDRFNPAKLAECMAFLKRRAQWKALFLGCLVKRSQKTECPSALKVSYRCLAHAYVINRPFAQVLAGKPWHKRSYDAMLSRVKDGIYAIYPSFAFQSDAFSDNTRHRLLDGFRRSMGGLKRIQKANEWCHYHRNLLIGLHLTGLLLLLCWLAL